MNRSRKIHAPLTLCASAVVTLLALNAPVYATEPEQELEVTMDVVDDSNHAATTGKELVVREDHAADEASHDKAEHANASHESAEHDSAEHEDAEHSDSKEGIDDDQGKLDAEEVNEHEEAHDSDVNDDGHDGDGHEGDGKQTSDHSDVSGKD